jgi:hypothetical protein
MHHVPNTLHAEELVKPKTEVRKEPLWLARSFSYVHQFLQGNTAQTHAPAMRTTRVWFRQLPNKFVLHKTNLPHPSPGLALRSSTPAAVAPECHWGHVGC